MNILSYTPALTSAVLFPLLSGVKRDVGSEAAEELMEGLVLLREQGNRAARYWLCPACDRKFHRGRDYLAHVESCHEELVPVAAAIALPAAVPPASGPAAQPQQSQLVTSQRTATNTGLYVTCLKCQVSVRCL